MTSGQQQSQQTTVEAIQMDMQMFKSDEIVNWLLEYQVFEPNTKYSKEKKLELLVHDHCRGTNVQNFEELYRVLQHSVLRELSNPTDEKIQQLLSSESIDPLQRKVLLLTLAESRSGPPPQLHTPNQDRQRSNSGTSNQTQYLQEQNSPESILSGASTVPYSDNQKMSPPSSSISHPENDTTPLIKPLPSPITSSFNPNAPPFQFTPPIINAPTPHHVGVAQPFNNPYPFTFAPPYSFPPPMAFATPNQQPTSEEAAMPMFYFPAIPPPINMPYTASNLPPSGYNQFPNQSNYQQSYPYHKNQFRKSSSSSANELKANKGKNNDSKEIPNNTRNNTSPARQTPQQSQQPQSKTQQAQRHYRQPSPNNASHHHSSPNHNRSNSYSHQTPHQPISPHMVPSHFPSHPPSHSIPPQLPNTNLNNAIPSMENPWINYLLEQMPEIDRQVQPLETPSLNARNQLIHCLLQEYYALKEENAKLSVLVSNLSDTTTDQTQATNIATEMMKAMDISHKEQLSDSNKTNSYFSPRTTAQNPHHSSPQSHPQLPRHYNSPSNVSSSRPTTASMVPLAQSLPSPTPPTAANATSSMPANKQNSSQTHHFSPQQMSMPRPSNKSGHNKHYRPPPPHHHHQHHQNSNNINDYHNHQQFIKTPVQQPLQASLPPASNISNASKGNKIIPH